MISETRLAFQLSCAPGIEQLLAGELRDLTLDVGRIETGSVELSGSWETLERLAERSFLAEAVRVRVGRAVRCDSFGALEERVARLPWAAFLPRGGPQPRLRVSCHRSRLYHSDAVAERVLDVLRARLGCRPPDETSALIIVRIDHDRLQFSIDACGELYRRGYRRHVTRAPLRETLAAACVRASGWTAGRPLWDPFCGSGTLLLEAWMAANQAIISRTEWPFTRWPCAPRLAAGGATGHGDEVGTMGHRAGNGVPGLSLFGSDLSAEALRAARHNERLLAELTAGQDCVPSQIVWLHGDPVAMVEHVPRGTLIVANPPYGRRLHEQLARAYRGLKSVLGKRRDLGAALLLPSSRQVEGKGLRWQTTLQFRNRGLPVSLFVLDRG